MELCTAFGTH